MFCKKCGAEIADNAAFCPKCGERVNQVPPAGNPYPNQNYQQPYGGNPYGYNNGYHRPASSGRAPGMIMLIVVGILVLIGGIVSLVSVMQLMPYARYLGGVILGLICPALIAVGGYLNKKA